MANKKVKTFDKYCKENGLLTNSRESLEKFRINYLLKEQKMETRESYRYIGSIEQSMKAASTAKNGGKELVAKTMKDFDKINHNSKSTKAQYKKNNTRLIKIAVEHGLIQNPNFNELNKEKYNKVIDIIKENLREKGKNDEQIEKHVLNYSNAYNFAIKELGPNKSAKEKERQRAIDFWLKPHNAQKYLPKPPEGITEKLIERTIKILRECDKMVLDTKKIGEKKSFNDYPKHQRNFARYLLASTNRDSMYVVKTKDFCGFITSMKEHGISASVQQNAPTAIRFYADKFNWKYKDTIPKTNVGLGADKRAFARIDNSATNEEVDRARAYFKEKGMYREYYAITVAAGGSLRIEEGTDEVTLKKLEKALKEFKFHVDDGKNGKPRDSELFDSRTYHFMKETYEFMKENNLNSLFEKGGILNPKGLDQRALIHSIDSAIEDHRYNFQDKDRVKRSELNKKIEDSDKNRVVGRCFLTMHSFRANYAVNAYEYYKQLQLDRLEKYGIDYMKSKMFKFYKDEIERKKKINEERAKEGKNPLKIKGKVFKDLEKDIIRYIEDSSMLYSSRQIGHNRIDVTRIYICKIVGKMRKFVDLETFKEYHAA